MTRTCNAGQNDREGYHVVGPLECWGDPPDEEQGIAGIEYAFDRFDCGIHDFNQSRFLGSPCQLKNHQICM